MSLGSWCEHENSPCENGEYRAFLCDLHNAVKGKTPLIILSDDLTLDLRGICVFPGFCMMTKRLKHLLVIDLESTCWEGASPPGQIREIIEIGICPVNVATLERLEKRSILVKPEKSEISGFCTELTTITPSMLTDAGTFRDAVHILKTEYHSQQCAWASWGDYDRLQFERNCREYNVVYPFGRRHLNIKTLFSLALGLPYEIGLDRAYEELGMTLEGTPHRGVDDAWNCAGLLCDLLRPLRQQTFR